MDDNNQELPDWHYDFILAARINRSATDVVHLDFVAFLICELGNFGT